MRKIFILFVLIILIHKGFSQVTVHVLNPWRNDSCVGRRDALRMIGNNEVGYYPGSTMTPEGGDWYYYLYKDTHATSFVLTTWCGPENYIGAVTYRYNLSLDSMLAKFPSNTMELWITIPDTTQPALIYDYPPGGKVIHMFNPWPDNSPQMVVGGLAPQKMRPRKGLCGWYTGYFFSLPLDSLVNVSFIDFFHTQKYTAAGLGQGGGIDLRPILLTGDTVYILPKPSPAGPPSLSAGFPGTVGTCASRTFSAHFRDWTYDTLLPNPSFISGSQLMSMLTTDELTYGIKNLIQDSLSAPDYKPKKTTDLSVHTATLGHVETWFVTDTFPSGSSRATNDTIMDLPFKKGDYCGWELQSDSAGNFFPLDNFINPNNIKYSSSSGLHNFQFTMEMHVKFIYRKNLNYTCHFKSDDDLWVFVNNRLAVDLGGIHPARDGILNLDSMASVLRLVDGNTYSMDIFYTDRVPTYACFTMNTTMDIFTSDSPTLVKARKSFSVFRPGKIPHLSIPFKAIKNPGKYISISGKKYCSKKLSPQPLIEIERE